MVDMPKKGELFGHIRTVPWLDILSNTYPKPLMQDLSTNWLQCDPGPLFKPEYYSLGTWLPNEVS